ncbi:phage holin [Paenibacillus riograndensis]|uniref:phage holin n=1 Tax=Paenibacillus riograndensis TaxID=483937 RepID=UPI000764870C|nr:phage holin [Paenibacillus riograndensis]
MKEVWDQVQPQVATVVVTLIGIGATVAVSMLALLQRKVKVWLASKTSLAERELIHKIASEAYAFAEKEFKTLGGPTKLSEAYNYASKLLDNAGLNIAPEEIKAAIEKAVLEYKKAV